MLEIVKFLVYLQTINTNTTRCLGKKAVIMYALHSAYLPSLLLNEVTNQFRLTLLLSPSKYTAIKLASQSSDKK